MMGWSPEWEFMNTILPKDSSLLHYVIHSCFYWRIFGHCMVFSDSSILQQQLTGVILHNVCVIQILSRLLPKFQFPQSAFIQVYIYLCGAEPPPPPRPEIVCWSGRCVMRICTHTQNNVYLSSNTYNRKAINRHCMDCKKHH
jgi:hypothetical protein